MTHLVIGCLAALLASATGESAPPAAVCGDGNVDAGEECDDGNTRNNDGCDASCHVERFSCGDGVLDVRETCGESNDDDDNSCTPGCPIDVLRRDQSLSGVLSPAARNAAQ